MQEAIKHITEQFAYDPIVENAAALPETRRLIVAGMGGSHLGAGLMTIFRPKQHMIIHRDYGLPPMEEHTLRQYLIICSSYSGNTEEVLDAFETARSLKLPIAVIASGGALLERAKALALPYIALPETNIQPRSALGYSTKALCKLIGDREALDQITRLAHALRPSAFEDAGKAIATLLKNRIPLVYASTKNFPLAYNWKIKFNETGKIPAFANVFPELNHNEMTGFDAVDAARPLSRRFTAIILTDTDDDPRISKRANILAALYQDRGIPIKEIILTGSTVFEKIFASLILADWAAYYTARSYGADPEHVPMIEEFKERMKQEG